MLLQKGLLDYSNGIPGNRHSEMHLRGLFYFHEPVFCLNFIPWECEGNTASAEGEP